MLKFEVKILFIVSIQEVKGYIHVL